MIADVDRITALFNPQDAGLIRFVTELTLRSGQVTSAHIDKLRALTFTDRDIHDIVMVSACFAFMNRLADGTGVTLQPDRYPLAAELFGDDALTAHLEWAQR